MRSDNFKISLILSLALHGLLVYLLFFFKISYKSFPQEQTIVFEMLDAADVNNVINQTKEHPKANDIPPEEAKKVLETAKTPSIPDNINKPINNQTIATPPTPPVPAKTNTADTTLKDMEKELQEFLPNKPLEERKPIENKEEKNDEPKVDTTKTQEQPKPEKKKEEAKKSTASNELESLLKNLEAPSKGLKDKSNKIAQPKGADKVTTKGNSTGSNNLSLTEINLIKQQIERVWNLPVGATNSKDTLITLYIHFDENGDVLEVKLVNADCPNIPTTTCKAIADSAIRAVKNASPIEKLRKDRYSIWQKLNIQFDPNDILQ